MKDFISTDLSRGSKVIQVIKTDILEGKGTDEAPMRIVTYYYDLEGNLICRKDTVEEKG